MIICLRKIAVEIIFWQFKSAQYIFRRMLVCLEYIAQKFLNGKLSKNANAFNFFELIKYDFL